MVSFKNKYLRDPVIHPSQNQEWNRLRKWEGKSTFKVVTLTSNYIQISLRKQFSSLPAFPFISAVESYLLLKECVFSCKNTSLNWRLAAYIAL